MDNLIPDNTIVIYGAGAIGSCIGGWLSPHYEKVYLLARGDNAEALKSTGLTLYHNERDKSELIRVKIIEDLNELPNIDVVIIAVKNYNLEEVAKDIHSKLGDKPLILALQNGVENQKILPKYFTKIIYCVVFFSAWRDEPGIFGYHLRWFLILGTLDNSLQSELKKMKEILKMALNVLVSKKIQNAIHTKIVYNLSNALLTLVNFENINKSSNTILRKLIQNVIIEGIKVMKAAGYEEHSIPGMIPWKRMIAVSQESDEVADKLLLGSLRERGPSSLFQDVVIRQKQQTELNNLTGYVINLANVHGIDIPYNKTIYDMCKTQFQKKPYQKLEVENVWNIIQEHL